MGQNMAEHILLAPRFQPLPASAWSSALPIEPLPGDELSVLGVRCGMKDCPSKLGRVARQRLGHARYSIDYQAPRGFRKDRDGETYVFRESLTAQRARRSGLPLQGRRAHRKERDWDQSAPLGPKDMPGPTHGLDDGDPTIVVECHCCSVARAVRFTRSDVQEAFDSCYSA